MSEHFGDCQLTRIRNPDLELDEIRIDKADPHILIIDELLREVFWLPSDHPSASLRRPSEGHGSTGHGVGDYDCQARPGGVCFYDSILTITGTNRTMVYRIGKYRLEDNTWEASWPD